MKKISILISSLRGGGAERAMLMFARGALDEGFAVDVITGMGNGPLHAVLPEGARLVDLKTRRSLGIVPPLIRYLRRERPDALYATVSHMNVLSVVARGLSGVGTKLILRESNSPLTERKSSITRRVVHFLAPLLYPRADAVISVSEGVAEELYQMAPRLRGKTFICPQPVISDDILALGDEEIDHDWFREKGPPVILGVGRLQPQKDFPTLLKAFAKVRKVRDARLVILGEGGERERLEKLAQDLGIRDDLSMPGFTVNPFPYMKGARLFVLSSRFEGMPNVLLQAMAMGAQVVATDCRSGPREILRGGELGGLVPVGDPDALASALLERIDNERPNIAGAELIRERYGVATATRQYLKLIE